MSSRGGKLMNYTATVLNFKRGDIFALNVYANVIWIYMPFTFSIVKSPYFSLKKSVVSTSFFHVILHTEFTIHMDATRTKDTPNIDKSSEE